VHPRPHNVGRADWPTAGHSGLMSDHRACSLFVPAIPQTCLHALTWNIRGTVVSALCTISQSTRENCWNDNIPAALNSSCARVLWVWNLTLLPVSDVIFSFPAHTLIGSRGNCCCLGRSSGFWLRRTHFAPKLHAHFNWASRGRFSNSSMSFWWAEM
jgi:hypothetical protein